MKVIEGEGFTTAITGDEKSVTLENGSMIVKSRETVELKPDTGRGSLPTLLAFAWSGPNPTGPMLLERFRGAKH